MGTKLQELCVKITKESQELLVKRALGCKANLNNAIASFKKGRKYTKVDVGSSGKYMIENSTKKIFGIKAYGIVHKGHQYGTLDTINDYFWGDYTAVKIK